LTLQQCGDIPLKFDNLSRDGSHGSRPDQITGYHSGEGGGAKDGNVAYTHANPPTKSNGIELGKCGARHWLV
jgi:hypothetical protein